MIKEIAKLLAVFGVMSGIAVAPGLVKKEEKIFEPNLDLPTVGTYENLKSLVKKADVTDYYLEDNFARNGLFITKSALSDGAMMVEDASESKSAYSTTNVQSETVWRQADKYNVPRIAYINKMDIMGADFFADVQMMKDRLGANAVPMQLPIGKEDTFKGIIDLVRMKSEVYYDDLGKDVREEEIPEDMKALAEEYRNNLLEAVAEEDEDLMMKYLEGQEITIDELKKAVRKATIAVKMTPVFCGSSYKNKGVQMLLDAVVDFLPAPIDVPHIKGTVEGVEGEVERASSDEEPFAALAFKIMTDPFVGKLCFFRVYSGDIAAAVGLKNVTTGDTLCDEAHPIILESMEFPDPVISVAIEPKDKASQEKMGIALAKLAEEDPTFKTHTDQDSGQTIISGMGELHLDIIVDRMKREFKVECNVGKPQVAYKETIRKKVKAEGKFIRQSGGRGQYGHAIIEVVPKEYIGPIDTGIQEAMETGILAGYPVVDLRVTLVDGSYHDVDSSEMAFKIAGSMAIKEAQKLGESVLLEPVEKVDITVPEEYMGDVIGDINSRRGRLEGMEDRANTKVIHGYVPLSEMFGYATDLRSRTQGRGAYSMQFDHYEEVPKSVQEAVIGQRAALKKD